MTAKDLTDWLETTIDDSFDLGWTSRDAATLIVSRMQSEGLVFVEKDRAEDAEAEVRRLNYSTTHTCWDECPRLACAQRREIEALTAQLSEAREHLNRDDPVRDTLADSDGDDGA